MHFTGPPHLRAQAVVPHSALEFCLQIAPCHEASKFRMGRSQPDSLPEVTGVHTGSESRCLSVVMARRLPVFSESASNPCRRGGRDFTKLCTWLSSLPHAVESSGFAVSSESIAMLTSNGADISDAQVVALEGQAHTLRRHGMHVYDSEAQLPVHLPVPQLPIMVIAAAT
jgi:hypothetical protein